MSSDARYAVYFGPAHNTALFDLGRQWLGRDVITGRTTARPPVPGISQARIAELTESPRHYGFHATLKAPFSLAAERTPDQLHAAVAALAADRPPFMSPPLVLESLHGFLALVFSRPCPEMQALCDACVEDFEEFRAPLTAVEREKRLRAPLTDRQRDYLDQWGYPGVFDAFTFHMTLTQRLQDPELTLIREVLADLAAPVLWEPIWVDAVAVYEQPDRESPFMMTARYPLKRRSKQ